MRSISRYLVVGALCLLGLTTSLKAQHPEIFPGLEKEMSFYGDAMINAASSAHRVFAHEQFYEMFSSALQREGSHLFAFDSLIWISQLYPPDSSLRIFTWQLKHSDDQYSYYGFVQSLDDGNVIELKDTRPLANGAEYSDYDNETWYGALYYAIQPFKLNKNTAYLIMGFDGHSSIMNRKIADIMRVEDGRILFGSANFVSKDPEGETDVKKRIVLNYADAAPVHLRYDPELQLLIYDHLISVVSGAELVAVPDGSYEAYKYNGKQWQYMDKVFDQTSEEEPRPFPVLDDKKKDLFGRERKN